MLLNEFSVRFYEHPSCRLSGAHCLEKSIKIFTNFVLNTSDSFVQQFEGAAACAEEDPPTPKLFKSSSTDSISSVSSATLHHLEGVKWKHLLTEIGSTFELTLQLLVNLHTYFHFQAAAAEGQQCKKELHDISSILSHLHKCCTNTTVPLLLPAMVAFVSFLTEPNGSLSPTEQACLLSSDYCHTVLNRLWSLLDPTSVQSHYKVAELFLALEVKTPDILHKFLREKLAAGSIASRVENMNSFDLLWRLTGELNPGQLNVFTEGLFVMLDHLEDEDPQIRLSAHTWLLRSMYKLDRLLHQLLWVLLSSDITNSANSEYRHSELDVVQSVLERLRHIAQLDGRLLYGKRESLSGKAFAGTVR